jgi:hypothetical protein
MTKSNLQTQPPSPWQQQRVLEAIRTVRERLLAMDPTIADDPELMRDMIDGESEAIDRARALIGSLVRASEDASMLEEAGKQRRKDLDLRIERQACRKKLCRDQAIYMMEISGLPSLQEADFLARVQEALPQLAENIDIDRLPAEYVRTKREANRAKILSDLRAGKVIPGASLNNGPPYLVVYTK